VVFARKAEAVAAMKRYNTVQLDGKPMQIEVIGTIPSTLSGRAPAAAGGAGVMVQAANGARPNPTAQRIVVMGYVFEPGIDQIGQ
jgi:THO complex subunit 4